MRPPAPPSRPHALALAALLALAAAAPALAQPVVLFDGADRPGEAWRDASAGSATGDDVLLLAGPTADKLPVTGGGYFGPERGVLAYRHGSGAWDLFIAPDGWQPRDLSALDTLVLYLNGPAAIPGGELPRLGLEDTAGRRSLLTPLGAWLPALDADSTTWQRVAVPLRTFSALGGFSRAAFKAVRLANPTAVNAETRTLWLDHILAVPTDSSQLNFPAPPTHLVTRTGDRSVILHWDPSPDAAASGYRVYRAEGASSPALLAATALNNRHYVDFSAANGITYRYEVRSVSALGVESLNSPATTVRPDTLSDEAFLDLMAQTAFDYFWYEADSTTGLVRDRDIPGISSSIAATGFGLSAVAVAVERGWVAPAAGRTRILRTLQTLWNCPQGPAVSGTCGYKGFFYHFLNTTTALRTDGGDELSTIDTALLLGGVLHVREAYASDDEIRTLADDILHRTDWAWAMVRPPTINLGWFPESGFLPWDWVGYNEAMIVYVLALGSPTHTVPSTAWDRWVSGYRWAGFYGFEHVNFSPLFGHQYTHVWVDFRDRRDAYMRGRGIDYFENSRRAALSQRAYAIANPRSWPNYGADEWGLTAADGPPGAGYRARGASALGIDDDGTIAPTAAGASYAFTPQESLAALRAMYSRYRTSLWGSYGLKDAYNVKQGWFDTGYIGIDQGPLLLMIENGRRGTVWAATMRNADLQRGLLRAGFQVVPSAADDTPRPRAALAVRAVYPLPAADAATVAYTLPAAGAAELDVYDVLGRQVARVEASAGAGEHTLTLNVGRLPAGVYFLSLRQSGASASARLVVAR